MAFSSGARFEPGAPPITTKYSNYPDGRSVRRTLSDVEWAECGSGVGKIAGSLPAVARNIESKKEFLRKAIAAVTANHRKAHIEPTIETSVCRPAYAVYQVCLG